MFKSVNAIKLLAMTAFVMLGSYANSQHIKGDSTKTSKGEVREVKKMVSYGITIEQDMLVEWLGLRGKNEDRNYTMGVGLFFSNNKWAEKKAFKVLNILGQLPFRSTHNDAYQVNVSINVGVTGFTPRYLGNNTRDSLYYIVNDRPFSSLTFGSIQYHSTSKYRSETNQLVIGLLGLGIAEKVQTHIHENHWFGSTRDIPTGWANQLSDGGDMAFLLSNKVDRLLSSKSYDEERERNLNTQFIFSREYRVGYYTGASAGMTMKFGFIDPNNWSTADTYQLNFANAIVDEPEERKVKPELYFQAAIRPHLVLYNAHLLGWSKNNNFHDFSFSEMEKFLVEGFLGIGATIPNAKKNFGVNIVAYLSGRTPEFKTKLSSRNHVWGGLQLKLMRIKPKE